MRNYKQLFAICKKYGFDYKDKVAEFTHGKTDSLKQLSDAEFNALVLSLHKLTTPTLRHPSKGGELTRAGELGFVPKPGDAMRKKIIALAKNMQWHHRGSIMQQINHWCLHYGKYKIALNQHSPSQLAYLLTQFEEVYKSYLKDINPS